jgi:hypothetical protein
MKGMTIVSAFAVGLLCAPPLLAGPAAVIRGDSCEVVVSETLTFTGQRVQVVVTNGPRGTVTFRCQGRIQDYSGGQKTYRGFTCNIPLGDNPAAFTTTRSQLTISRSGNGTLTCVAKTNATP